MRTDVPQIVCTAPSNFGKGHPLVVSAGGLTSAPFPFDYDTPVISSVTPSVLNAVEGSSLIITGQNFGLQAASGISQPIQILIRNTACKNVLFIRDSEVRCDSAKQVAAGVGNVTVETWNPDLLLSLNVSADAMRQQSSVWNVNITCPQGYYGREGEVRSLFAVLSFPWSCCLVTLSSHFCFSFARDAHRKRRVLEDTMILSQSRGITSLEGVSLRRARHPKRAQVAPSMPRVLLATLVSPARNVTRYPHVVSFSLLLKPVFIGLFPFARTSTVWL